MWCTLHSGIKSCIEYEFFIAILPSMFQTYKNQRCLKSLMQSYPRIQFLLSLNKCTTLSAVALSQTSARKPRYNTTEKERIEVILAKNLLTSSNQLCENRLITKENIQNLQLQRTVLINNQRTSHNEYNQRFLVWEDVLLSPRFIITKDETLKPNLKDPLIDVMASKSLPGTWYCNAVRHAHSKKHNDMKGVCLQFSSKNAGVNNNRFVETRTTSGPSPEQLSLVLLRLREELPCFFEGCHRYSIYSEDLLFVNKLTRTTTRSLKVYKFIMKCMQYAGRIFWSKVSLDVIRITKHPEDNTIKLRWTAKGMPWYQRPYFVLSGKPQSAFYRYIDGFSIFEVGRDGLIHCHRLDKVIPTSSPERHKWSLKMQILTLLGLAAVNRRACEAFQVKNQDMLKKV